MKANNRWIRLAAAAGSLLWAGSTLAQSPQSGTAAGGPSNGYAGSGTDMPAPSRANTPTTATSRSAQDEAKDTGAVATDHGLSGTISRVDTQNNTIELQGDRKLKVDPNTEIRRNGKDASFSDLREGDQVRASFGSDAGLNVKRIDVMPGSGSSSSDMSSGSSSGSTSTGNSSGTGSSRGNGTTYGGPSGTSSGTSQSSGPSSTPSGGK